MIPQEVIDELNLRRASAKDVKASSTPVVWSVVFGGCGHQHVLSDKELHGLRRREAGKMEDTYFCEKCALTDKSETGPDGYCTKTTMHPITMATPLYGRQLNQAQQTKSFKSATEEKKQHSHL
jgi:hypothetical protein